MQYPNGSISVLSRGPWSHLVQVRKAICSDGIARTTCRVGVPDTHFSIPAAVKVFGKTVTGFLTYSDDGYTFHANQRGKNAMLLADLD
jgi:hypothetical protein